MPRRDYIPAGGEPDPPEPPLGGPDYIPGDAPAAPQPPAVKEVDASEGDGGLSSEDTDNEDAT